MKKIRSMLARWFGRQVVGVDRSYGGDLGCKTTGYWFGGKLYITKMEYFNNEK